MKYTFPLTILLALAAGAGAGITSAVMTTQSLNEYSRMLLADRHLPAVATTQPTPIPGTYEEALNRVRENTKTGIATLMPASKDSELSKELLPESSALGYGAVVSDDGWVLIDGKMLKDIKNPVTDVDVWVAGKRVAITSVVADAKTGAMLLKTSASGVTPLGFATTGDVKAGTMMFAVDGSGGVALDAVIQPDAQILAGAQPAEQFATTWLVASGMPTMSMPLVNAAGELAGFIEKGSAYAVPLHHMLDTVRNVVKTKTIASAFLGAYTVDIAREYNLSADVLQNLKAGAIVLAPDAMVHATVRGGPAAEAGFASRDIILAVDGVSITESESLAEILESYAPNDVAKFTVLRAGKTLTISVTLGDAQKLVY